MLLRPGALLTAETGGTAQHMLQLLTAEVLMTCFFPVAVRDYRRNNIYTARKVDRTPLDVEQVRLSNSSSSINGESDSSSRSSSISD